MSRTKALPKSTLTVPLVVVAIAGSLLTALSVPKSQISANSQAIQVTTPPIVSQVNVEPDDIGVNREAVLAIAFAGSAALGVTLTALSGRSGSSAPSRSGLPRSSQATIADQANHSLLRKLLRLLHDDRKAASRLLMQAELKYPGKSANWYVEKVIFDLQRDRGKY